MDIIFTGSRNLTKQEVYNILRRLHINTMYVGDCPTGGDKYAREYANEFGIDIDGEYRANWERYGAHAGPIRNAELINTAICKSPLVVGIAIRKVICKGTDNAIRQMKERCIPCKIYNV